MIKKIKFYKSLLIELIETLCTICLVLDRECRRQHIHEGEYLRSHFSTLKNFSYDLRGENKWTHR